MIEELMKEVNREDLGNLHVYVIDGVLEQRPADRTSKSTPPWSSAELGAVPSRRRVRA